MNNDKNIKIYGTLLNHTTDNTIVNANQVMDEGFDGGEFQNVINQRIRGIDVDQSGNTTFSSNVHFSNPVDFGDDITAERVFAHDIYGGIYTTHIEASAVPGDDERDIIVSGHLIQDGSNYDFCLGSAAHPWYCLYVDGITADNITTTSLSVDTINGNNVDNYILNIDDLIGDVRSIETLLRGIDKLGLNPPMWRFDGGIILNGDIIKYGNNPGDVNVGSEGSYFDKGYIYEIYCDKTDTKRIFIPATDYNNDDFFFQFTTGNSVSGQGALQTHLSNLILDADSGYNAHFKVEIPTILNDRVDINGSLYVSGLVSAGNSMDAPEVTTDALLSYRNHTPSGEDPDDESLVENNIVLYNGLSPHTTEIISLGDENHQFGDIHTKNINVYDTATVANLVSEFIESDEVRTNAIGSKVPGPGRTISLENNMIPSYNESSEQDDKVNIGTAGHPFEEVHANHLYGDGVEFKNVIPSVVTIRTNILHGSVTDTSLHTASFAQIATTAEPYTATFEPDSGYYSGIIVHMKEGIFGEDVDITTNVVSGTGNSRTISIQAIHGDVSIDVYGTTSEYLSPSDWNNSSSCGAFINREIDIDGTIIRGIVLDKTGGVVKCYCTQGPLRPGKPSLHGPIIKSFDDTVIALSPSFFAQLLITAVEEFLTNYGYEYESVELYIVDDQSSLYSPNNYIGDAV